MWKRDQAPKPGVLSSTLADFGGVPPGPPTIGKSVVIKGELNGSEDLTIEGQVEGTIQLRDHVLTIGPNARIKAQVFAKAVIVQGEVTGNVTASDRVDIRDNGSVDGDIVSPRFAIAEGAHFRGSVDMQRKWAPANFQRLLVELSVPDSDANAEKHMRQLQRAVSEFLSTFGFSVGEPEPVVPNFRQRTVAQESRESRV